MTLASICRVLGKIWLGLGGTVVAVGTVATWYFQGWRAYQDLVSPFNLFNYIAVVIAYVNGPSSCESATDPRSAATPSLTRRRSTPRRLGRPCAPLASARW